MRDSTFRQPPPPGLAARTAAGHFEDRSAVPGRWHVYPAAAAAGLWTTATDLAKLIVEVQRSLAGESNRVLSAGMTDLMLTEECDGYGLGFLVSGSGDERTFGHYGRGEGFDAHLLAFAAGQGLV